MTDILSYGKRKYIEDVFKEDANTPTREICKRFKPIDISHQPTYVSFTEKINRLENINAILEEKLTKTMKDTNALEDKYKEQNLILKKYMDKSTELTK